jgi:hypothetical protein
MRNNSGSYGVRIHMRICFLSLVLVLGIFIGDADPAVLSPASSRHSSPSQHVTLSASIVLSTEHISLLKLSLRNTEAVPVTILTGLTVGGVQYPAAFFRFAVVFRDHSRSTLWCTTCAPTFTAGFMEPYKVTLAPHHIFDVEIPLVDFRTVGGQDKRWCTPETKGARLAVTLEG